MPLNPLVQSLLPAFGEPAVLADVDALAEPRDRLDLDALGLERVALPLHAEAAVAARRDYALGGDYALPLALSW